MKSERAAIDLLEEAVNLLRAAPAAALVAYLAGAVPFVLAMLYFLNDMTHSPFASEHLAAASLGLAALFVWKNVWQAIFAARLMGMLSPSPARGSLWRLVFMEAALQPVSLLVPLPFPWIVAFFRNVSMFAAGGSGDPLRSAARQSTLWTRQNWAILSIMSLAALLIFLNAGVAIIVIPQLARSFLGIEGDLARSGNHILNLSTLAAAAAIAWLVIDPILDAVYVLRCFYGESIATGADLRLALRRAVAALVMMIALATSAHAQAIDPVRLDHSIDQVIHSREFTWRTPRPAGPEPQGRWAGWLRQVGDLIRRAWDYVKKLLDDWLNQKPQNEPNGKDAPVSRRTLELLIGLVVAVLTGAAVAFFLRRRAPVVAAQAVTLAAPAVDLAGDSVSPDQLPEAAWMQLADEWMAKGDARLAMRALHLAGLNYLGQIGLVSIRKWKSGLDYRREIDRRARTKPTISPIFSDNIALFEQSWYGMHPVNREMVDQFASRLTRIREASQ